MPEISCQHLQYLAQSHTITPKQTIARTLLRDFEFKPLHFYRNSLTDSVKSTSTTLPPNLYRLHTTKHSQPGLWMGKQSKKPGWADESRKNRPWEYPEEYSILYTSYALFRTKIQHKLGGVDYRESNLLDQPQGPES